MNKQLAEDNYFFSRLSCLTGGKSVINYWFIFAQPIHEQRIETSMTYGSGTIEEQLNRESDPGYTVVTPLARSALARRKG
jgi:hypothetical protein